MAYNPTTQTQRVKTLEKLTRLRVRIGADPYNTADHWKAVRLALRRERDVIPCPFEANHLA